MSFGAVVVLVVGYVVAGYVFYVGSVKAAKRHELRTRIVARWQLTRVKAKRTLHDETLSNLLHRSGFRINAVTYQGLRVLLTVLATLDASRAIILYHSYVTLLSPVIVWFLFEYKAPWPASHLFRFMQKLYQHELNKDLYLLMGLVKQHLQVYKGQRRTVYDIFSSVSHHVPRLRYATNQCLTLWARSPDLALDAFAKSIGTEQAEDLARILRHINESRIDVALDVMNERYKSFQGERLKAWSQRQFIRNTLVFAIAMGAFSIALIDVVVLYALYNSSILQLVF